VNLKKVLNSNDWNFIIIGILKKNAILYFQNILDKIEWLGKFFV
jgi:hypothetical protein